MNRGPSSTTATGFADRVRAVRLDAPGRHRMIEMAVPPPETGQVLIRVAAAGVCGSDVELFAGRRPEGYVSYPVVPGHEWAGTVLAVGPGVSHVWPGAPVVAEGFRWCGVCARCREGQTTLCLAGYAETGFTHPGGFAEVLTVPAHLVHRLPPAADLHRAALLEPAACIAAGLDGVVPPAGASVAVVGAGTLGLLAVQMLALHHPRELLAIDPRTERLHLAASLGATRTADAGAGADGQLPKEMSGRADLVLEAAGHPAAVATAMQLARSGGTVVLAGISGNDQPVIVPDTVALRALHLKGVFGAHSRAWQHAVSLFSAGALTLEPLISHRMPLSRYADALQLITDQRASAHKVLLLPPAEDA